MTQSFVTCNDAIIWNLGFRRSYDFKYSYFRQCLADLKKECFLRSLILIKNLLILGTITLRKGPNNLTFLHCAFFFTFLHCAFLQEGTLRVGAELLNVGGVTEFCLRPPQVIFFIDQVSDHHRLICICICICT